MLAAPSRQVLLAAWVSPVSSSEGKVTLFARSIFSVCSCSLSLCLCLSCLCLSPSLFRSFSLSLALALALAFAVALAVSLSRSLSRFLAPSPSISLLLAFSLSLSLSHALTLLSLTVCLPFFVSLVSVRICRLRGQRQSCFPSKDGCVLKLRRVPCDVCEAPSRSFVGSGSAVLSR